jgi:hypothetical protein
MAFCLKSAIAKEYDWRAILFGMVFAEGVDLSEDLVDPCRPVSLLLLFHFKGLFQPIVTLISISYRF